MQVLLKPLLASYLAGVLLVKASHPVKPRDSMGGGYPRACIPAASSVDVDHSKQGGRMNMGVAASAFATMC